MRHEFTARTKKAARARAGGACEAVGPLYGLPPGKRCGKPLGAAGGDVDHYPLPAHADGSDGLDNAVVCCKACHAYKTATYDIPAEAKIKRIQRKYGRRPDNRKPKPKMRSRQGALKGGGFQKGYRPLKSRNTFKRSD